MCPDVCLVELPEESLKHGRPAVRAAAVTAAAHLVTRNFPTTCAQGQLFQEATKSKQTV